MAFTDAVPAGQAVAREPAVAPERVRASEPGVARGPVEVQAACERALAALAEAFATSAVTGSLEEWAGAVGSLQRVVDVATAAQDAAIARLAAIEPEQHEDGTWADSHRALGHVALDAPAVVSGVLSVTALWAQRRVRTAVRLAADGPSGADTETGLGGLHSAMAAGRLDGYRASVLAEELEEAPPEVAATVVAALDPFLEGEDAGQLRRRCRRALVRISPDLLKQRAQRARADSGLRRWAEEPGVDRWEGTFPSEEAAQAWAAIDALAQRYVAESVCPTIERARAKALTDLVAGNATIETVVTVTVPATELPAGQHTAAGDLWPHQRGGRDPRGGPESQSRTTCQSQDTSTPEPAPQPEPTSQPEPESPPEPVSQPEPDLPPKPTSQPEPDLPPKPISQPEPDLPPSSTSGRVCSGDDLIEVGGLRAGDPVLVPRDWLAAVVSGSGSAVTVAPCHPVTGALSPAGSAPRSGRDAYRPPPSVAAQVRARDRRCRFPGCTVGAVFCDLDHVRPWPAGPTAPANLMCLCRRHHRVKQRPGWRVVLAADGVATWTDPTGRVRSTEAVDALRASVIPDGASAPQLRQPTSRARTVLPDGPHSVLEFLLEHLGAGDDEPADRSHDSPAVRERPAVRNHPAVRERPAVRDHPVVRNRPGRRGHSSRRGDPARRLVDLARPRQGFRLEELRLPPQHRPTWSSRRRHAENDLPPF